MIAIMKKNKKKQTDSGREDVESEALRSQGWYVSQKIL